MNNSEAIPAATPRPVSSPVAARVPLAAAGSGKVRLFRKIDWLTLVASFLVVGLGYYLTLAPELTLEDSGELATGSFYAGIPHPPGYPVWTLYTWLWTVLVPFKNVAWRVALGEAASGALAAGLLGMLVSRGSSLLIESLDTLQSINRKCESAICITSGFVAALLIGFNGFMWSQSVIVEVYSFSVASLMLVLVCLLRWIYSPNQRRYLYLALFFHGLCFTNHQTLVVAAIGIEVAIAAAHFRMGRYLWLGNSIIYVAGLFLKQQHVLTALENNQAIFVIFNVVGVASIGAYVWFAWLSRAKVVEFCLDAALALFFISFALVAAQGLVFGVLAILALGALVYFARQTATLGWEWLIVMACGLCWLAGAAFYFYMPLGGMTNPPMQWGYPRTVEGFIHAFTRGQYDKANPSDIFHHPLIFLKQLGMLGSGIIEEFNWVYAFIALVPFAFLFQLRRRERAWLIGLAAIYLCLGVLLLILLNPPADRAAQSLVRVFFTASHTVIALLTGYGLSLIAAWMGTHYSRFRSWGLLGGGVAIGLALLSLAETTQQTFFGQDSRISLRVLLSFIGEVISNQNQYGLPVWAGLLLIGLTVGFVVTLLLASKRAPIGVVLGLFALMPLHSVLTHWSDNEQRQHWFGYWFGHDMFKPPFKNSGGGAIYPEMPKDTILFGGTDPGRFCPTYMIFCDSLTKREHLPSADRDFDRRDVYIITQNALADGTYLEYIRAHYNRSAQIDPPFFQEFLRSTKERQQGLTTNALARAVQPLDGFFSRLGDQVEKRRRTFTSWFTEQDFVDVKGFVTRLLAHNNQDPVSQFVFENVSDETRKLFSDSAAGTRIPRMLARDLNLLLERELKTSTAPPLYNADRFRAVRISEYLQDFIKQNPRGHTRIRLNRLLLEAAYPSELAPSRGGVYPDREIAIPSNDDLARAQEDYLRDAARRYELKQLKPGENVAVDASGRVAISGQIAVMGINGLVAKVIFDRNPKAEFFVEESFPLDWMYPHLSPYGIIMKINRQPLAELSEETLRNDHDFWSQYSERLVGNWITYETPVKVITDWVERVYLRRNFTGFTGDRRFIRDDQAQKSFSKLRSAIGGLYLWRLTNCKEGSPEQQRLIREADFTFRQAFALCPYSPEAVFRYVTQILVPHQRIEDAILVAATAQKLDPYNSSVNDLLSRLKEYKEQQSRLNPGQLEKAVEQNPDNLQAVFQLAGVYVQSGRTGLALTTLDRILNNPGANANAMQSLIEAYITLNNAPKLEQAASRLAAISKAGAADPGIAVTLAEAYRRLQKPDLANQALDAAFQIPNLDAKTVSQIGQQYANLGNVQKVEAALERLAQIAPEAPEAWYDLAGVKAILGKQKDALEALRRALTLNAERLKRDPKALNLLQNLTEDPRFGSLRPLPEFRQLTNNPQ